MSKTRLPSSRLPFDLSIGGAGVTYEKSGGATLVAVGSGVASMRRRRRVIPLRPVRTAPPVIHTKSGGAIAHAAAGGARQIEHLRTGGASVVLDAGGFHGRTLRGRLGGATAGLRARAEVGRDVRPRAGGAGLGGAGGAARVAVYAEHGGGQAAGHAGGVSTILRGDDGEDLWLLGFDAEEEELLALA